MPIAIPAAMPLKPHARPAAKWAKPVKDEYCGLPPSGPFTANMRRKRRTQPESLGSARVAYGSQSGRKTVGDEGETNMINLQVNSNTGAGINSHKNCRRGKEAKGTATQTSIANDDSNNQPVNTKHTSHDNWNDGLHHKVRLHHAH
eukprot:6180129-Pleurochrysis_carterae.AAC.2